MPSLSRLPVRNLLVAGILLMLAGGFMFALNDAIGEWLAASFSHLALGTQGGRGGLGSPFAGRLIRA